MAPFNPPSVALGADGSFVARTMDRDPKHMKQVLGAAHEHTGASFVEIYQNCNIFNDGAFFDFTEKATKPLRAIFVEHGEPMTFDKGAKGLRMTPELRLEVIDLESGDYGVSDCFVHDEANAVVANLLASLTKQEDMPRPFGVFYREERTTFDALVNAQREAIVEQRGEGDLSALLSSGETWEIG
jgi:2-oxoglutarate ferredoxin oxidoreductase subunit beta